ncbi:MAG: cupin domain-containing protein [Thiobacillaceae bacterium]
MTDKSEKTAALELDLMEALASHAAPIDPGPDAAQRMREKLMQRVRAPAPDYLFVHSHQGEWVALLRGVDMKLLRQDESSRSYLVRMAPRSRIPPHEHALDEESLVLEGEVTLNGVLCKAGDYHMAPHGLPHEWVRTETGCLLYIRGAVDTRVHE